MSDFASEYGIRLATTDVSWREFIALLVGLLSIDSRLSRARKQQEDRHEH